jgi:hypothetical protein
VPNFSGVGRGLANPSFFHILPGANCGLYLQKYKEKRRLPRLFLSTQPIFRNFATVAGPCIFMKKLYTFFQQYRQYILTDGLMYLAFFVILGLMFLFFS